MTSKTERKICGTCEYWCGKREPVFDKDGKPKIRIDDSLGLCMNEDSKFTDQKRKKDACCKCFSKWTEIL